MSDTHDAERRLAEAQERYRALFERSLNAVYVHDFEGNFLDANDAALDLLGYERDEIQALTLGSLLSEADLAMALERMAGVREKGFEGTPGIYSVRHKNGSLLTLETLSSAIFEDGEPVAVLGVARDLTDRARAERFMNLAGDLFIALDVDGKISFADQTAYEVLEAEPDELRGEDWFDTCIPERDRARVRSVFRDFIGRRQRDSVSFDTEGWVVTGSGKERLIRWHNVLLTDSSSAVVGVLSSGRDVTEEVKTQRALGSLARRFSALLEALTEGIWAVDEDTTTTFVNDRMAAMIGYEPDDIVGRSHLDFIPPEGRRNILERFERRRDGVREAPYEFDLVHRDGHVVPVRVVSTPLEDEAGRFVGTIAGITDLSFQREAEAALRQKEDELRQSQKLEALGRLSGSIAHDFNNMLGVILSHTELLMDDIEEDHPHLHDLEKIRGAALLSAELTGQLLAFSRKQPVLRQALDLNETVAGIRSILERAVGERIEVVVQLSDEPLGTNADPPQLRQVLMNLVVNARDAMPEGGRLTIKTGAVEGGPTGAGSAGTLPEGRYVYLAVSDTGEGMSESVRSQAFEPFFTTKPVGKGTGLGLSTVYGIIKQTGGYIFCTSAPGMGSTFEIFLPASHPPAVPPSEIRDGCGTITEARILLVEDDKALRPAIEKILIRLGYDVESAPTGDAALDLYRQAEEPPDLVITDVVMPEISGPEFVERIRKEFGHRKVLFISGYAPDELEDAIDAAVQAYFLPKPFTMDALAAAVEDALSN